MSRSYIFSSESVGEGHPDKVCDTISDAILDACLAQDPMSRVACETYAKSNIVVVGGEITTKAKLDYNEIIRKVIPAKMLTKKTEFLINPTGRFVIGGPQGDTGLTGRKIIVDTYGGMGRHGGGAFSGKDPTKVDRSAAYMGRYVAKNVVAAGLAARCEVQFAYAIGHPDPVSIHIDTFGTATVPEEAIEVAVKKTFGFKPSEIITQLKLRRPIYLKTTNYGHFGKNDPDITWEKTDKATALKKAALAAAKL